MQAPDSSPATVLERVPPASARPRPEPVPEPAPADAFDPKRSYRLSRHAHLRPIAGGLVAESPLSGQVLALTNDTQIALVLHFLQASRPVDLLSDLDEARQAALLKFLAECRRCGLLTPVEEGSSPPREAEESEAVAHWEHHDLLFHSRSRRGRAPFTIGATYQGQDSLAPEPALSDPPPGPAIELPKLDLSIRRPALMLTEALEARRSLYRTDPVSLAALGEFLYRTSRITDEKEDASGETLLRRVYPSGGSLHALELYVVPARCPELSLGLYQYRADSHRLISVADAGPDLEGLLEEARRGTGRLDEVPSVLLIFTARLRRLARKYSGLSYALILKEIGAAFQTFYLVAAEMGLAPCALGTGDSDAFARASGKDYFDEPSVGEFILGGPA